MPNEVPVVFQNGSNYDYHFIMKELVKEFEGEFVLGENAEKYRTFSAPIEKEVTKIDKDGNESVVTISYKIKFINSARFMATSLSNLTDNIAEGIHKIKCKDFDCFLEYEIVKDNLIKHKCLSCNKDYSNKLDEKLKKRFKNTFKFSVNDINKSILLLRKGVVLMGTWMNGKRLMKQHYLKKKEFYSNLNVEDITDADYINAKRVCKNFEIKKLGEYHVCISNIMHYFWLMFPKTLEKCV